MDIFSLGIPNIRTTRVGSRRDGVEIVEAVVRLEAWDGYLVKRWENGRAITDWTIVLDFAGSSVSAPEIGTPRSPHITDCSPGSPTSATAALQNFQNIRNRPKAQKPFCAFTV